MTTRSLILLRCDDCPWNRDVLCTKVNEKGNVAKRFTENERMEINCNNFPDWCPLTLTPETDYKEELIKFIDFVLENELPHEQSWDYATALQKFLFEGEEKPEREYNGNIEISGSSWDNTTVKLDGVKIPFLRSAYVRIEVDKPIEITLTFLPLHVDIGLDDQKITLDNKEAREQA